MGLYPGQPHAWLEPPSLLGTAQLLQQLSCGNVSWVWLEMELPGWCRKPLDTCTDIQLKSKSKIKQQGAITVKPHSAAPHQLTLSFWWFFHAKVPASSFGLGRPGGRLWDAVQCRAERGTDTRGRL